MRVFSWMGLGRRSVSASRLFADPEFDGEPALVEEQTIDDEGNVIEDEVVGEEAVQPEDGAIEVVLVEFSEDKGAEYRKYYYDGGSVEIAAQVVYELDADGKQLKVVSYADYAKNKVKVLYTSAAALEADWRQPDRRSSILGALAERGIDLDRLGEVAGVPDADPLDLLCHLAFNGPLRTRRERAERVAKGHEDFFDRYGPEVRDILSEFLDKYTEGGLDQLKLPDVLKLPPISDRGNPSEIRAEFRRCGGFHPSALRPPHGSQFEI